MFTFLYQWIDLLWLPIVWFTVNKDQRPWAMGFVVMNIIMLRLQSEMMISIDYANGFLGLISWPAQDRGFVVYGIMTILYLVLIHYFPATKGVFLMALSISFVLMGFIASMLVMLL